MLEGEGRFHSQEFQNQLPSNVNTYLTEKIAQEQRHFQLEQEPGSHQVQRIDRQNIELIDQNWETIRAEMGEKWDEQKFQAAIEKLGVKPRNPQAELDRLTRIREEANRGNYAPLQEELQRDIAQEGRRIDENRTRMKPRGQMRGDELFFEAQQDIVEGENTATVLKGIVTPQAEQARAWTQQVVEKARQRQGLTERGSCLQSMERSLAQIGRLQTIQKSVPAPRPPTPPANA
jgi:multidrug efflux pump subunit AcrB